MRKIFTYKLVWFLFALPVFSACNPGNQKKLNKRVSLWRKDKIPYGTYYAHENLKYIFPEAEILIDNKTSKQSRVDYWTKLAANRGHAAAIIITKEMDPTDEELNGIFDLINQGDQVFISALSFSERFLDSFKLKDFNSRIFRFGDSLETTIMNPVDYTESSFSYPGYATENYFTKMDSTYVRILGKNKEGRANFININYKSGANLYLHLEPFVFSNFFLLHKNNKTYYDYALSYLPPHIKIVSWSESFHSRQSNFSALDFLLKNESFKWAFWLLILLFLILYVFESKRKQRVVPAIAPLRNSSLDFVKTVGRLYYQRRDNLNLANKMFAHFLGHVRAKYNLPTSSLDKEFAEKLSYKSGYDKELTKDIVDHIKVVQLQHSLSDEGLLQLNKKFEDFYKQT